MQKKSTLFRILLSVAVVAAFCVSGQAAAQSIKNITLDKTYGTLEPALAAVGAGETLEIRASGTYECRGLAIGKDNVTLRGAAGVKAVLNCDFGKEYCLEITGNGVTIQNLEIGRATKGISIKNARNITLSDLRINNINSDGIHAENVTGLTIDTVTFYQINRGGISVDNSDGVSIDTIVATNYTSIRNCILITGTKNLVIGHSVLGASGASIDLTGCPSPRITSVAMVYGNNGLNLTNCPGALVDGLTSEKITNTSDVNIVSSDNCVIQNGTLKPRNKIAVQVSSSSGVSILNMRLLCTKGQTGGISLDQSPNAIVRYCEIRDAGQSDAITMNNSTGGILENNLICSGEHAGIQIKNNNDNTLIKNNTILNNNDSGIILDSNNKNLNIRNNIVAINWKKGVECLNGTIQGLSLTYNDVWNNRENYSNCTPGTGSISVDPRLVNGTVDAHLQSSSPCIDTGDPGDPFSMEPDFNGGRIDMGAYGGTSGATRSGAVEVTIAQAAANGWINLYCYSWNTAQYSVISGLVKDSGSILPPWTGFWVIVNRDLDIVFPHNSSAEIPASGSVMPLTVQPGGYYQLSVPLTPSNTDANAVFGDDLGEGLYDGAINQMWRVSKWDVDQQDYIRYTGPGSLPALIPGRGIWFCQVYDTAKEITVAGNPVDNTRDYALKLKSNGGPTYHMIGNPFPYSINWADVKVRAPMTGALPAGKIAAAQDMKDIVAWHVDLGLSSTDGAYIDTNNRAGVIESGPDYSQTLNAVDIAPFSDDYIRLYFRDPGDAEGGKLSFDYRGPMNDSYSWDVVLSTTMQETRAVLSLGNLGSIPAQSTVTLAGPGLTATTIAEDTRIPVTLTGGTDMVYHLTVTRAKPLSVASESLPRAFAITSVFPNPFNPSTTIGYTLDRTQDARLTVYNLAGQKVATLADGRMSAGSHATVWNAAGCASGIYMVILETAGRKDTRKITLLK